MEKIELNRLIDHTLLKPEAAEADIRRVCGEAIAHDFFSVCVNTHYVPLVARELAGTRVKVCSIAGFPLGAVDSAVKAFEAARAVGAGAHEIDMVMNIGALKSGDLAFVRRDIEGVVGSCGARVVVKVIIEAALLTDDEKRTACGLVKEAGAHFVKTSTGFGPPGATTGTSGSCAPRSALASASRPRRASAQPPSRSSSSGRARRGSGRARALPSWRRWEAVVNAYGLIRRKREAPARGERDPIARFRLPGRRRARLPDGRVSHGDGDQWNDGPGNASR